MAEAVALHQSGRHDEAERKYLALAAKFPRDPDLLHFRGLLASHTGDQKQAIALIEQAIEIREEPEFYQSLAISHQQAGDARQASHNYNEQGVRLQRRGQLLQAKEAFQKGMVQDPRNHWAAINYAATLNEVGDYKNALGILREVEGTLKDARERSLVLSNIGNCHYFLGKPSRAAKAFRKAIDLYPGNIEAHRSLSLALLMKGDLVDGFAEYEWRCVDGVHHNETRAGLSGRVWRGESPADLAGPLLVLAELGLGDTIHFSRYVPLLAARGHDVLFEVQPELHALFGEAWRDQPRIRVIPRQASGKLFGDLPFVALVSVMSLPHRFGITPKTIPAQTPYLSVLPQRIAQWGDIVPRDGRINVGLVWRGGPAAPLDRIRSIQTPDVLEPLLARDKVRFYSLQKGEAARHVFASQNILSLDERLHDFADTAAAIGNLDLVISIDSSVAHLAGALDCPVWIMMPRILDWRMQMKRRDMPWYPKTRLFRQRKPDDWTGVVAQIGRELDRLAA